MFKKKIARTQITDLARSKVQVLDEELVRLVSGGEKCGTGHHKSPTGTTKTTNVVTGRGSWDTDRESDINSGPVFKAL